MVQMFWACIVALSGSYDTITDYAIFALTLFYMLVAASIFIFRRRMPDAERPYRTWGYPVVPILFMIVSVWLIFQTIRNTPRQSAIGLGLILLGLPVYWLLQRRQEIFTQRRKVEQSKFGRAFAILRSLRLCVKTTCRAQLGLVAIAFLRLWPATLCHPADT